MHAPMPPGTQRSRITRNSRSSGGLMDRLGSAGKLRPPTFLAVCTQLYGSTGALRV